MNRIKLVIFDCDGVMFDSKDANRMYYNHILEAMGRPPMTEKEVDYVHIHNVMDSVRYILRKYPEDIPRADEYRQEVDYQPFLRYMNMEDGLVDFLNFLLDDYELAISTNRTNTMESILAMFNLSDYFPKVMTAMNSPRPKPHPDALLEILDHYGRRVEEAIYIGDSIIDQEHAASAGMDLIAFKNPELKAAYHVNSFHEVSALPLFSKQPG